MSSSVYLGDYLIVMKSIPAESVDAIVVDPPYNLSNGGGTCEGGKWACVDKGDWDKSRGLLQDHEFNAAWLAECRRLLKPDGTIRVSGTYHVKCSLSFVMHSLDYRILNDICWFKPNASPNPSRRYFTASHEPLIWAVKDKKSRHTFKYSDMNAENNGMQMLRMKKNSRKV